MARPRKNPLPESDVTEQAATQVQTETSPEVENVEIKLKKKGTRPGWRPAGQIPRLKAPKGFTPKWSNPDKLDKLRAEGWILMKPEDNKGQAITKSDVNDVGSLTGALRYRELVAIMLPNELKEDRDEWLRNENQDAMKNILKQTDEQLQELGVQTYAPTGQAGRIVID
jgi:hypothetical protein